MARLRHLLYHSSQSGGPPHASLGWIYRGVSKLSVIIKTSAWTFRTPRTNIARKIVFTCDDPATNADIGATKFATRITAKL